MKKKKVTKTLQETKKSRTKIKGRFELPPSRQPLRHKALWDLEDELISKINDSHITTALNTTYFTLFSNLYSCSYNWLDYSSYLYEVYEVRSLKAYVGIHKVDYFKDVYKDQVESLEEDFLSYYGDTLGLSTSKINKQVFRNTCLWFIYHLNRVRTNNQLGLRFSYWVNFYTEVQASLPSEEKIGGTLVKRLIDYLVHSEKGIMFKGYKLKDSFNKNFHGSSWSGETKSCMSLMIFNYDSLQDYLLKGIKASKHHKNYFKPTPVVQTLYEIRKESKCKTVISLADFEEEWMDKVRLTEKVLHKHGEILNKSMISIGKYQIPEIHFRRIWIGSVYDYGRLHDSGEFQTKSKRIRKEILIDEEETCTIDLSAIHPRILYTQEGIQLSEDFDPYPNLDWVKLEKLRVKKYKAFYNFDKYNPLRNLSKVALLILINSKSMVEAKNALVAKLKNEESKLMSRRESEMAFVGIPADVDIDRVLESVKEHNKAISKYFATGVSMSLMNKDSDIIVDTIDSLSQLGVVCLPLHDSVTVAKSYKEEAKKALAYGYKSVMGTMMNFKCEEE